MNEKNLSTFGVGRLCTEKDTGTKALEECIQRQKQRKILRAFGTFEFRKDWDYKADRPGRESRR